jgi:hypothetical protein
MPTFLFVKEDCVFSIQFIRLIDQYWKHNDIEIIFMDQLEEDEKPDYVDKTPSILLVDKNEDSKIFEGQEAFDWLHKNVVELYSLPVPVDVKSKKDANLNNNTEDNSDNGMPSVKSGKILFGGTKGLNDHKDFTAKNDVMKLFEEREADYTSSENAGKI